MCLFFSKKDVVELYTNVYIFLFNVSVFGIVSTTIFFFRSHTHFRGQAHAWPIREGEAV